MAEYESFLACVFDHAAKQGFGDKRAQAIADRYTGLAEQYTRAGHATPEELAAKQVFNELHEQQAAKAKLAMTTLDRTAEFKEQLSDVNMQGEAVYGGVRAFFGVQKAETTEAHKLAAAVRSTIERDQRSRGNDYSALKDTYEGQLWAIGADILDHIEKGAFGRQKGAAHLSNAVREIFGEATTDAAAKEIATAWHKVADAGVDLFNGAGGAMRKLKDWNLPQRQTQANLLNKGGKDGAEWVADHINWLDWGKMAWPDGSPIEEGARVGVLQDVYKTLLTDGVNKIDPVAFGGRGGAVGNAMNEHRFLRFKDADAWIAMHDKYGDGNVFDVMTHHVSSMAHQAALLRRYGPNPEQAFNQLVNMGRVNAEAAGGVHALATFDGLVKNKVRPMADIMFRKNAMDPESTLALGVNTTTNLLSAAQMGSAFIPAMAGDATTVAYMAAFNKTGIRPFKMIEDYLGAWLVPGSEKAAIAARAGVLLDGSTSSTYAASRFTGPTTYGQAWSSRLSDNVLRASGMNGHTEGLRFATQHGLMGLWAGDKAKTFDQLPYASMLDRYGIGPAEWDAFRAIPAHEPSPGADFLRPVDILNSGVADAQGLFEKWQGLIINEGRFGVPDSTIEARAALRLSTRPDSLPGAVLHSFSMYKNLPVSMIQMYGRLAMVDGEVGGRLKAIGGLAAALTMSGALALQMKEIAKGRDPLPMNTPSFLGNAMLAGGAMGIMGDFLFSHVNRFGAGPAETIAGPLAGFAGDATNLVFGDAFKWAGAFGHLDAHNPGEMKLPARAVEFAKRYTPGTNIWYARLALERNLFDRLSLLADPKAYQSWNNKVRKQQKENGNDYYWRPGAGLPGISTADRAPSATGLFGR